MNLDYSAEDQAFRDEVRRFCAEQLPADLRDKVRGAKRLGRDDYLRWQRILADRGWGAPSWPVAFGGTGWNAVRRNIFEEETFAAGAPPQLSFGLKMVAPVLMRFGTTAQQQRFLPGIRDGTIWFCQGYSEPGAGSDLASLRTRAVRDGDHYVVDGQKTWTTLAQHADWMFCLVRTDPEARKQEGISFLLLEMDSPGVTVRPIELIDGEHEVNEVFLDGVRVPVDQRIGEENQGWTCAKYLLGHERSGAAALGASKAHYRHVESLARRIAGDDGRPMIEDVRFRDRLARVRLALMALEVTALKAMTRSHPGSEAQVLKLEGSAIRQSITELHMQLLGPYAAPYLPERLAADFAGEPLHAVLEGSGAAATAHYFNFRKTTIYGGSNEVQRNIIAKHVLGL